MAANAHERNRTRTNPPGKLADAELHFTHGVLDGLKLVGFAIWGNDAADLAATSRSLRASTPSAVIGAASHCCAPSLMLHHRNVYGIVLQAYATHEGTAAGVAS